MTIEQLKELITSKEGEQLEFKEARKSFHFETLVKYCAALANEGGGKIVLGVTDKRPRSVVGSGKQGLYCANKREIAQLRHNAMGVSC